MVSQDQTAGSSRYPFHPSIKDRLTCFFSGSPLSLPCLSRPQPYAIETLQHAGQLRTPRSPEVSPGIWIWGGISGGIVESFNDSFSSLSLCPLPLNSTTQSLSFSPRGRCEKWKYHRSCGVSKRSVFSTAHSPTTSAIEPSISSPENNQPTTLPLSQCVIPTRQRKATGQRGLAGEAGGRSRGHFSVAKNGLD